MGRIAVLLGILLSLLALGRAGNVEAQGGLNEAEKLKIQIEMVEKEYDKMLKQMKDIEDEIAKACQVLDEANQRVGTDWVILDVKDCTLFKVGTTTPIPVSLKEPAIVSKAEVEEQLPLLKAYGKTIGFFAGGLGVIFLFLSVASSLWKERYASALVQLVSAVFLAFVLWLLLGS